MEQTDKKPDSLAFRVFGKALWIGLVGLFGYVAIGTFFFGGEGSFLLGSMALMLLISVLGLEIKGFDSLGHKVVMLGLVGWIGFTAYVSIYWYNKDPLATYTYNTDKKGKPQGILEDGATGKARDIQKDAQGHWTVVAFTVMGAENVGYEVGGHNYNGQVSLHSEAMGGATSLLLSKLRKFDAEVWVVRLDHAARLGATGEFLRGCGQGQWCASRLYLAGQERGGRYGNYFDTTIAWLKKEWFARAYKAKDEQASNNGLSVPFFAILDPDGDLRLLRDNASAGEMYIHTMRLMGKADQIELPKPDYRKIAKQRWNEWKMEIGSAILGLLAIVAIAIGAGIWATGFRDAAGMLSGPKKHDE
jgi:hypothetical protein